MSTAEIESVFNESITIKTVHAESRDRWCMVVLVKWTVVICLCVALLHCGLFLLPPGGAGEAKSDVTNLSVQPRDPLQLTRGELWPRPQIQQKSDIFYTFDMSQLKVNVVAKTCHLLTRAIKRYKDAWDVLNQHRIMLRLSHIHGHRNDTRQNQNGTRRRYMLPPPAPPPSPRPHSYQGVMCTLKLHLTKPCDAEYPYYKMDESYSLTVANSTTLKANSIWGLLHAFETFNQLLYYSDDYTELLLNETNIFDFPRYAHRGLLLDTGRNHLTLNSLYRTLDAMAMNKMNVFHWHIVDDQSFPYVSEKFPKLSEKGACDQRLVYSTEDIKELVKYAAGLGIRVIPEFDVPGHTRSWGKAYPELLTKCYSGDVETGLGPLNPINPDVYKLLQELFEEVQELFPDKYQHIGGDEVNLTCWQSNPELAEYMRTHNLTSEQLQEQFVGRVMQLLGVHTIPVVWQEVFEIMPLPYYTLVQVWKPQDDSKWLEQVIKEGHEVLYSSAWYLDRADATASSMYSVDPRRLVASELALRVAGGEACMWGETVNDTNLLSRVWPRASVVAEVLWSPSWYSEESRWWLEEYETTERDDKGGEEKRFEREEPRLKEHACRMRRLGVPAQPLAGSAGPASC